MNLVDALYIVPTRRLEASDVEAKSGIIFRLMRSLRATRTQVLWRLRLPTALPYLFAGFETAMLFSAVGAVIGEFMGGNEGLGYVTLLAQELFRLDDAFSAIALLSLQGFLLHRLVVVARRHFVFWQVEDTLG